MPRKIPPGKSPGKSSKIYTTKILQHISADWPGQILVKLGRSFRFFSFSQFELQPTKEVIQLKMFRSQTYRSIREGVNREKLTVKKLIDNEMSFFHRLCPLQTVKNRRKPWKNRHQTVKKSAPKIHHSFTVSFSPFTSSWSITSQLRNSPRIHFYLNWEMSTFWGACFCLPPLVCLAKFKFRSGRLALVCVQKRHDVN